VDAADLAYAGIARQAELVRAGDVSPRELVDVYLERIERIDPDLNVFRVVMAARARTDAAQAESRVRAGDERPLLGVPVAVKDNVDVAGEVSAHGSNAYGDPAREDSEIARRLRAAGAIIIGKTHLSELAIFPWTETLTWGATRNPWNRARTAGGSSGGSGVAVAAGLVGAASASDGGGSIRIPASCNGVFGLKPQRGRVSVAPDAEHWHGLSSAGVITRTVLGTALYLDAIAGPAPGDRHTPPAPDRPFAESAQTAPGKLRVAVSTKPSTLARVDARVRAAVEETAGLLRSLGHEVHERDPDYGKIEPIFLPRWLRGIRDDAERMPHPERLERPTRQLVRGARLISDNALQRARDAEAGRAKRMNAVLEDYDVLLTPTIPEPPHRVLRWHGKGLAVAMFGATPVVAYTSPWNVTGQPAASLPAPSTANGVPIGVQLVARPNDEATILSLAAQLEAEIGWPDRRPPVG
jgi:amidase